MRKSKFTNEFIKKYPYLTNKKMKILKKAFVVKSKDLIEVYERGAGDMSRVYKFLLNVVKYRKGELDKIPKSSGSDWTYIKSSGEFSNFIPPEINEN